MTNSANGGTASRFTVNKATYLNMVRLRDASFVGGMLNDYGFTTVQTVASQALVVVQTAHTGFDSGGYIDTIELGVPTIKIPVGGAGMYRVSVGTVLGPSGLAPAFGKCIFELSHDPFGDLIVSTVGWDDFVDNLGGTRLQAVAWSREVWLGEGSWLVWRIRNLTDQTMNIIHAAPVSWLTAQLLVAQAAP